MSCGVFSKRVWNGVGCGLAGMFGFGAVCHPTDDDALNDVTKQLNAATAKWSALLEKEREKLTADQIKWISVLVQQSDARQQLVNETIEEEVESNHAFIIMLVFLVFFVIIYILTDKNN
jgi:hypothetical protein